jgi:hypothetical protein
MTPTALARHLTLPAAVNRSSGEVVPLSYTLDHPADVVSTDSLTEAQKIALIRARWLAGEWSDIVYDHMGLIDRDRAVRELEAQSDIGRHLMAVELRAIEMARQDAAVARGERR